MVVQFVDEGQELKCQMGKLVVVVSGDLRPGLVGGRSILMIDAMNAVIVDITQEIVASTGVEEGAGE